MSSISYRIELEPLGDFFFGGENTFSEEEGKNYFSKSNRFPQQTALLGMLRFELLKEKKLLPLTHHKQKAERLIGGRSFDFDRNSQGFDFGIIEKISPVFLADNVQDFVPAPFDQNYRERINWLEDSRVYLAGITKNRQIVCDTFDVKKYCHKSHYIGSQDKLPHPEDDFFESSVKIGVNTIKSRESGDDKEAFFKQEFIRLKKNARFVFYIVLSEDVFSGRRSRLVFLGGEQSMFRMNISQEENIYEQVCGQLLTPKGKVVLISDAYVTTEQKGKLDKAADFAWSDTVVFRNIKTSVKQSENYANNPCKSIKTHLVKKGSVFYYSTHASKDEITQIFNNNNLQRCGFNIYLD